MNFLGIDYGSKKIGLALADVNLAEPLMVIRKPLSKALDLIKKICQEKEIEKIVIGLPDNKLAPAVKEFGQKLADRTGLPIVYQDETLTTKEAIGKMIAAGKGKQKRREKEDAVAAAIILQSFLDNHV